MPQFDINLLVADWGAKYINEGQTFKDIKTQLFQPSITDGYFKLRPNKSSSTFRSVYATAASVLQRFAIPFASKGNLTFNPWEIELGEMKIDDLMIPDELKNSWAGFTQDPKNEDRSKWSIIQWYIQTLLLNKAAEDYENEVAFFGWKSKGYNATPTVNGGTFERELTSDSVALPANASMDGLRTQFQKMISGGRITPIVTGAPGTDALAWCNKVEAFVKEIPRLQRSKMDRLFMSEDLADLYQDGRREKYNIQYHAESNLKAIKNSNMVVEGLPSMAGSEMIWTTPEMNRVLCRRSDQTGRFNVQAFDRGVKLLNGFDKIITVDVPEFVYVNDQENVIDAGEIAARYTE